MVTLFFSLPQGLPPVKYLNGLVTLRCPSSGFARAVVTLFEKGGEKRE